MSENKINELLESETAIRSKENILHALTEISSSVRRRLGLKRFVEYFFSYEKRREETYLSREGLRVLYSKWLALSQQPSIPQQPRVRKLYQAQLLRDISTICDTERTHGDTIGTKGWVRGWLTTYATDAHVDIELNTPMFVTGMIVHAVNVKASPRSMELWAKGEKKDEWMYVRGFRFRDRDYEGSHGNFDYNKQEMFYVLGQSSNQEAFQEDDWQWHPLAGPGRITSEKPDLYMKSKFWRWKILDSNGGGYVGINNFSLYGREATLPSPENVEAKSQGTGATISWTMDKDVEVDRFHIIAHPGGFGNYSNGSFYEECAGTQTGCIVSRLSPKVLYQFQVVAVDSQGGESMPSKVTNGVVAPEWALEDEGPIFDSSLPEFSTEESIQVYDDLDGIEYTNLTPPEELTEFASMMEGFRSMIHGNFQVAHKLDNNKVTLYISGSLEDTVNERKYISKYTLPKLKLWCDGNGYDFAGVDLRWGLESEIADDHKTFDVHMQGLEKAFNQSSLVIFYFLSGERYGSVLLPSEISKADRDAVRSELKDSMKWIIDITYVLDENGNPPLYHLRKISDIESMSEHRFWDGKTLRGVHSLLKEIMTVMMKSKNVSQELKHWEPSLTIAECKYALEATKRNPKNKFLLCKRTLDNLYPRMESERDLPSSKQKAKLMGCENNYERRIITDLREKLENDPSISVFSYSFDWKKDGIDIAREDRTMKRICAKLFTDVRNLIQAEFRDRHVLNAEEQEMVHHALFAKTRSDTFVGREALLRTLMANIAATDEKITLLHGVSGSGKTSAVCAVAVRAKLFLPQDTLVMIRLCGTSPKSSSAKGIIRSLCTQIHAAFYGEDRPLPDVFEELVEYFHQCLETVAATRPIAFFIDSLDQLTDENSGRSQPWKWIPKILPANVFFVVSTLPDEHYGILNALLEIHPRCVKVPLLPATESTAFLDDWMRKARRTLTQRQKQVVNQCLAVLEDGMTMLHLRLIADQITRWSSRFVPHPLPLMVQETIQRTFQELEFMYGSMLVTGFLSLLCASNDGLSLENITDILSADEEALGGKDQQGTILEKHNPHIRRVPPFLISRLRHDLREYLVERGANGIEVLGLYHRQFNEVAQRMYLEPNEKKVKVCRMLIEYFNGDSARKFVDRGISTQPFWFFAGDDDRIPNKQKLVELPHAIMGCQEYEEFADLIMNFDYIEAKCKAGGVYATSLIEDYIFCLKKLSIGSKRDDTSSFFRFISTWFHVLKKNSTCLTTLALNYVPESPVRQTMEQKWDQKLRGEDGGWIRWQNAPSTIDPCIFTHLVPKAECVISIRRCPDSFRCAIAGNKFCVLYDFRSYQQICDFRGHTSWVRAVCFSPDGKYALSVSNDKKGKVWNTQTAEQCSELSGHLSWVVDCDWVRTDHMVLTVSDDGTARIWNPYFGDLIAIHEHHGTALKCGRFSPSGLEVVTGDVEGKIMLWGVPSCEVAATTRLESAVHCIQWNRDGSTIAAASFSGQVVLLNHDLEIMQSFEGFHYSVNGIVFSPNGKELLAAGAERVGHVYNVESGSLLGRLVGHNRQIMSVDWMKTEEGSFLLTGSEDCTVKQWQRSDIIPGDVFETFAERSEKPSTSFTISFAKDGSLYGIDDEMHMFQCKNLSENATAPFLKYYAEGPRLGDKSCGVLSPDGKTWAVCSYGNISSTLARENGENLRSFELDTAHNTLVWDPTGEQRFFASGHGNNAVIWNAESGEVDSSFNFGTWVWNASWSANGNFLAIAHEERTDVFDMRIPPDEDGIRNPVFSGKEAHRCALNSDGSQLAIVSKTGNFYESTPSKGYIYELKDLDSVPDAIELEGDFDKSNGLIFTSDDQFLLVSFLSEAFGSSPSICAFDSQLALPFAWFISPMNNDFKKLVVPYNRCSKFVAVDSIGKIYVFEVEES